MIGRCYQSKNGDDMTKLNLTAFLSKQEKWQKAGKNKNEKKIQFSWWSINVHAWDTHEWINVCQRKKTSRRHRDSVELVEYEIIYMSFD